MAQTNVDVIKAVLDADENLATQLAGIAPENYADVYQALTDRTGATTPLMNEFLSVLVNKIIVQRIIDPLNFNNPFSVFMREIEPFGDVDEYISVDATEGADYNETANPFTVNKGPAYVFHMYTKYKRVWSISFSFEILRAAFMKEYELTAMIDQYTKKMRDRLEIEIYTQAIEDLATGDWGANQVVQLPKINTTDIDAWSKTAYTKILETANKASTYGTWMMNEKYTKMNGNIPLGSAYLFLYAGVKTNFDVSVMASLLNSAQIGSQKYFKEVRVITDPEGRNDSTTIAGYILKPDSYIIRPRIDNVTSIFNPANLINTNFLHNWRKQGINYLEPAIKLTFATV